MADQGTCAVTIEAAHGNVVRVIFDWISTAGGAVEKAMTASLFGSIQRLVTKPDGVDAPTDDYDITLEDADGCDVLNGVGIDRDTANTEQVSAGESAANLPALVAGLLTFKVGAAGNAKAGRCVVYLVGTTT